ncbi:RHS repeat domain-containing protein [Maribacter chungangensis]|uniref:RHS repeat domain-containing protein n=2 Tax=Maribacter chungangensis TaxID=1069117 RepID=A0ABW3B4L1_9FLAO
MYLTADSSAIRYNHLNLPVNINVSGSQASRNITYVCDARGVKLCKVVVGSANGTTEYTGNYIYEKPQGGIPVLQFFSTPEGYAFPKDANDYTQGFDYVYQYKDHLGNVRLSYTEDPSNPGEPTVIEENNYHPFGLKHKGYNNGGDNSLGNDLAQKWKFGGKELDESLGLETYDFGARNYDPAIGRWMNIDPLAEDMRRHSPHNYAFSNPINFIDPDGMKPFWINNGDGTYTAEAGDSAATLAEDAGISMDRANEIVEGQLGKNYIGEDGGLKSNVEVGDVVDIPESDVLSDQKFNETFLSGRNTTENTQVEVADLNEDGKLDAGIIDGDTTRFSFGGDVDLFSKTVDKGIQSGLKKGLDAVIKKILKVGRSSSYFSPMEGNKFEDGLVERRRLGLPGNASQREVDSAKIVKFMMTKRINSTEILKD